MLLHSTHVKHLLQLSARRQSTHAPSSCPAITEPMSLLVAVDSARELSPLTAPVVASDVLVADFVSRPARKLSLPPLRLLLLLPPREGFLSRSSAYV
jgi:hypothetical protein